MRAVLTVPLLASAVAGIFLGNPTVRLERPGPAAAATAAIPAGDLAGLAARLPGRGGSGFPVFLGSDANGSTNPFVQPTDPAQAGGGIDQTQQFFDLMVGSLYSPSILIGLLGGDAMVGTYWPELFIGGPEHGNPNNRDKAFGGDGDDIFLWAPGDGSDRFDGGPGLDTVVFGLIGELDANGNVVFQGQGNQQAGNVWIDPMTSLPRINVSGSPGFCTVIDSSSSPTAAADLAAIGVDHLARFFVRSVFNNFQNGVQNTDNGLRVTLHLKDVEFLVCTTQAGGAIEVLDLRTAPLTPVTLGQIPFAVSYVVF